MNTKDDNNIEWNDDVQDEMKKRVRRRERQEIKKKLVYDNFEVQFMKLYKFICSQKF